MNELKTIKVSEQTRMLLNQIKGFTGKDIYVIVYELAKKEVDRQNKKIVKQQSNKK
jgi:hypothetical protein